MLAASRCGTCCGYADGKAAWIGGEGLDTGAASYFRAVFDAHCDIERVFFDGAAAEKGFGRLIGVDRPLRYCRLPSTSPAQTMRYADKLRAWRRNTSLQVDNRPAGRGRALSSFQ